MQQFCEIFIKTSLPLHAIHNCMDSYWNYWISLVKIHQTAINVAATCQHAKCVANLHIQVKFEITLFTNEMTQFWLIIRWTTVDVIA